MKKAGIVVGLVFIIAAIVICLIAFRKPAEKTDIPDSSQVSQVEESQPVQQEPVQQEPVQQEPVQQEPVQQEVVQQEPVQQQPIVQETIVEKVVTKEISGVKTILEDGLGAPISEKEVIVYIANKRILLVDENVESTNPKMLTYCFDVLTPENESLILFVTNSVYTQYNVNDKLMVKYQVYQNDSGIKFPLVLSVSAVN